MMNGFLLVLTLLAALGCGMMAGVFFAFSALVMKGLGRLPTEQGIAAMQTINVAAVTFAFMAALFGTAVACGALALSALLACDARVAQYLRLAGALYLVGAILLPIVYHVPRNETLATMEPRGADAESCWRRYLPGWSGRNHVR